MTVTKKLADLTTVKIIIIVLILILLIPYFDVNTSF